MEQLLLHPIGDYVTQTDWMARTKTRTTFAALCHAFCVFAAVPAAGTLAHGDPSRHRAVALPDRPLQARTSRRLRQEQADRLALEVGPLPGHPGYPPEMPACCTAFWLMILVDNTMHLSINYAALRWL